MPAAKSKPAYRTDVIRAGEHLEMLWPDRARLEWCARLIADSVRLAHSEAPASWEFSLFPKYARLNVGQVAVLDLSSHYLVLYSTPTGGLRNRGVELDDKFPAYAAVNVQTERWCVEWEHVERTPQKLIDRHRELVVEAARSKRGTSFWMHHAPGAIEALSRLAGGQIPQPDYSLVKRNPSQRREFDLTEAALFKPDEEPSSAPGSLFGEADRNREVERASVSFVKHQLEAKGWSVRSVERENCGYDLECSRQGQTRHVEVKGTRGAGDQFVITRREVNCSLTDKHFYLVVVSDALGPSPKAEWWKGGDFQNVFQLTPLQYVARRV